MSISSLPKGAAGPSGPIGPTGATGATGTGGVSTWTTLSKAIDQSVSNQATLQDDTDLQFSMGSSTIYRIRGMIFIDPTAAGDYKYAFIGPASPNRIRFYILVVAAAATPAQPTPSVAAAYPAASLTSTSANDACIKFDAFVDNLNSGTFKFQFAQVTATVDAGAIARAGSYIEYAVA